MPADVLLLRSVSKWYGDRAALQDVQFSIGKGESVGYLGPNGAGKTTTLKLLAGIIRPTSGLVRVAGLDPDREKPRALQPVGALIESPGLPPFVTGADLLEYVARVKGVPSREARAAARRGAEAMGVADDLDRPFGSLSTGRARRMMLGAALVGNPEVLLLDEPTLGLDPIARRDLRGTLRSLSRSGLTILLSTHLLEDVQEVCDRVLFLRDGTLVGDEPVDRDRNFEGADPRLAVCLRFSEDTTAERLSRILGPDLEVTASGPRELTVHLPGGDAQQVALLGVVVKAGLPLMSASRAEPDLARRYLELVGREDTL